MESSVYTIGRLAKAALLPASTLRYYERRGLIRALRRSKGDYRYYDRSSLRRLRFIVEAHRAGFTLTDIKSLLELVDFSTEGPQRCGSVKELLAKRIQSVKEQLAGLKEVKRQLERAMADCQRGVDAGPCEQIKLLKEACKTSA